MSSKTRTRKTRTTTTSTTGSARPLRSVPDQPSAMKVRTETEDKLWAALHAHPNSTAADLSAAAKIGKSTAQKILARWAGDGSVTRTPGIADGGRRAADLWAITGVDDIGDHGDDAPAIDAHPRDSARSALDDPTADASTEPPQAERTEAQQDRASDDATGPATAADTGAGGRGDATAARLAPGALRGLVEDYLRDHPGEEFGPTAIAKALGGKSSGAVSNALDKLVEDGTAVKTQDTPRRFALAPAEAATAPTPTK